MADRIMTLVLQLIQSAGKASTILEDAFLVVGSLAAGLCSLHTPEHRTYSDQYCLSHRVEIHALHASILALPLPRSQSLR